MNLLTQILGITSMSGVRMFEVLAIVAGSGAGALAGHRWQARSHRAGASSGRRRTPPAAGSSLRPRH
ncbi:MAG: hypothetical protein IT200_03810 [Thermoleophilia bacterium]|nr:hypothetical protein [Thermoleophilia bacterium]